MKTIAVATVLAVLLVGAGGCLAGESKREASGLAEDQVLRERAQVDAFMEKLTSSKAKIRNRAELNFKDLSDASAQRLVQLLMDAFRTGDADLQGRAIGRLAYVGPRASTAVPFLIEQGGHANADVRCRVAFALEKIGPAAREAIPALIKMLDDPSEHVRAAGASALRVFGREARAAVPRLDAHAGRSVF
jgi:HEAT repeat protein